MNEIANKAAGHTAIYGLSNILRHLTSFLMLPIYTRYLTTGDYGTIELMVFILDFVGIILFNRISDSIFRYYMLASSDKGRAQVISTALALAIGLNMLAFALLYAFSEPLSHFISEAENSGTIFLVFSVSIIFEAVIAVSYTFIRVQQKPKIYLFVSTIQLFFRVALNLYFVVYLSKHVEGVAWASMIANSCIGFCLAIYVISKVGLNVNFKVAKEIMIFSIPISLAMLGSFVLTFGDRYFLRVYGTLDEIGIYSLAYKFGFLLIALVWDPFTKFWDGYRYEVYKMENSEQIFNRFFNYSSMLLIIGGLAISLFVGELLVIMSDPAFHSAADYVPIIVLAHIFVAWYSFCNFGILLSGKTIKLAYADFIGAAIVVVAYMLLIPSFTIWGAAVATLIGFAARIFFVHQFAKRHYDMGLKWSKPIMAIGMALTTYFLSSLIDGNLMLVIAAKTVLMLLFLLCLFYSPIFSGLERREILLFAQSKLPGARPSQG